MKTADTIAPMRVLVLSGGHEEEHEVSIRSGSNVRAALKEAGYTATLLDPSDPLLDDHLGTHDVVLPILHGGIGENGVVQARLEEFGIAYLGSPSKTCAVTLDKLAYKKRLIENGYLTPNWEIVDKPAFLSSDLVQRAHVLKPISGGSSIDTYIISDPVENGISNDQLNDVFDRYEKMLLEELIVGDEITLGVLDDTALPVIQIIPPRGEEFDYENKYNGKTQEIVDPQGIPRTVQAEAQRLALETHRLFGCRHVSRTDMIVTSDGSIYLLEINTTPGMTAESLFPKAAAAAGYTMPELVDYFVKLAVTA